MSDEELVLADLASIAPSRGEVPTQVFVRPRRALHPVEEENVLASLNHLRQPGVRYIYLPHDFDLITIGDAELKKLGWTRIPLTITEAKP